MRRNGGWVGMRRRWGWDDEASRHLQVGGLPLAPKAAMELA